jgi:hypothetical protein
MVAAITESDLRLEKSLTSRGNETGKSKALQACSAIQALSRPVGFRLLRFPDSP